MFRLEHIALIVCLIMPSLGVAQNPQGMEKIERHKDIAQLMSVLNNWGVDMNVERQLKGHAARIAADLSFAGAGGVLIVARMQKTQVEGGVYKRLIGDRVDYVGIGANPVEAELSNIGKTRLGGGVSQGAVEDLEGSSAYWFSNGDNNEISMREKPYTWLHRDVINEIVRRNLESYDWQGARTAELTRLVDALSKKVGNDKLGSTITSLLQSRREAIAGQAAINSALKLEMDRAVKAAERQQALKGISFLTNYASFLDEFSTSPQKPTSPMTREQAETRLNEIKDEANRKAAQLANDLKEKEKATIEFDLKLEWDLRERRLPLDNLPLPAPPAVRDPG